MVKKARTLSSRDNRDLLLPSPEEREQRRQKLPKLEPHDLEELVSGGELILKLRERNTEQLRTLAEALGVQASDPRYWEKALFWLAHYCLGLGCLRVRRPKPRSNSSTWTTRRELALMLEMIPFTSQGMSDDRAIEIVMSDPKKRGLFPYRPKRDTLIESGYDRKARTSTRSKARSEPRAMAVLRHWQQMRSKSEWANLIRMLEAYSPQKVRRKELYKR
jgi:hypothetical protein